MSSKSHAQYFLSAARTTLEGRWELRPKNPEGEVILWLGPGVYLLIKVDGLALCGGSSKIVLLDSEKYISHTHCGLARIGKYAGQMISDALQHGSMTVPVMMPDWLRLHVLDVFSKTEKTENYDTILSALKEPTRKL